MYKYTCIDLFSGPGGLSTGLKMAGIKPLISVEINDETVNTYSSNHEVDVIELEKCLSESKYLEEILHPNKKPVLIKGDVRNLPNKLIKRILNDRFALNSVDIVAGCPPCESFSIAGKRDVNDDRDNLYKEVSRIAKTLDTKIIFFENVKGILSKKKEGVPAFAKICDEFEKSDPVSGSSFRLASWHKDDILLNCADYGVPQNRERVFLIGINNKYKDIYFSYPKKDHGPGRDLSYVTVKDALEDLPKIEPLEECFSHSISEVEINSLKNTARKVFLKFVRGISPRIPCDIKYEQYRLDSHKASKHMPKIIKRMSFILPGEGMKSAAERLVLEGKNDIRNEFFPKKPYGARYRRLIQEKPSFTVTSHCFDEMIHPTLNRALTPREAARLQTFPDWYIFQGPYVIFHSDPRQDRYEQIGDAVPPLMAYKLGNELVKLLDNIKND